MEVVIVRRKQTNKHNLLINVSNGDHLLLLLLLLLFSFLRLELAALSDDDGLGSGSALAADSLDGLDHVLALNHLAEDGVLSVEP